MTAPNLDNLPRRIVCGTDFSARSAEAANAAAAMAMRLNQPLLLVHSMAETFRERLPDAARDSLIPLMRERLDAEAERLRAFGTCVEATILKGLPDEGIAEFGQSCGAALLVVGATQHEIIDRCLTGNVAEVLAERSPMPTLMVRETTPFEAWARGERALRVVVGANFASVSDAAICWINELRRIGPCDVTVAHVVRGNGAEEGGLRAMKERVGTLLGDENSAILKVCGTGRIHHQLIGLAQDDRSDLLVIGTDQRHGFGRLLHLSVSRAILRHSPVSVACVPASVVTSLALTTATEFLFAP